MAPPPPQDYRNTSSKDALLYGIPRKSSAINKPSAKAISSSATLSFTNALSSLISASTSTSTPTTESTTTTIAGRPRPARTKPDIFTSHNRNTKKRAAADLLADSSTTHDVLAPKRGNNAADHALDDASWRRTKRKMEEKARLYAAMKRGDVDDEAEKHMVDFDRKWAEKEASAIKDADSDQNSSDSDSDSDSDPTTTTTTTSATTKQVEYTDEFGRTRTTTASHASRLARQHRASALLSSDTFTARPSAPTNLIHGDTIQSSAFNPDEPIAQAMADLAAKRDRELTPPEAVHYDADGEVRTRGTGFFKFSRDEEERKAEMERLKRERDETERVRGEREERARMRREALEERKKVLRERKEKMAADRFLEELGGELSVAAVEKEEEEEDGGVGENGG